MPSDAILSLLGCSDPLLLEKLRNGSATDQDKALLRDIASSWLNHEFKQLSSKRSLIDRWIKLWIDAANCHDDSK